MLNKPDQEEDEPWGGESDEYSYDGRMIEETEEDAVADYYKEVKQEYKKICEDGIK